MKRIGKIFLTALLFAFSCSQVFAIEEYVTLVYQSIDRAFKNKSDEELNDILSKNQKDRYYSLMENYTEKKIRRLIINSDYEFAMEAILVVIENNLDNTNAVEMYASVSDAYKTQQEYAYQQAEKERREQERLQREMESKRASTERNFVSSKTAEGNSSVYVTGKELNVQKYKLKFAVGLADFSYLMQKDNTIQVLNYGVSLDTAYSYLGTNVYFGFDIFGEGKFLPIPGVGSLPADTEVPFSADFDLSLKFAFPNFSKRIYLRAGYEGSVTAITSSRTFLNAKGEEEKDFTTDIGLFTSPFAGLKFEDVMLGPVGITFGVDYYPAHLWTDWVDLALGGYLNIEIPFGQIETMKLTFNLGVRDKFMLTNTDTGYENRASAILAIGVGNVNK